MHCYFRVVCVALVLPAFSQHVPSCMYPHTCMFICICVCMYIYILCRYESVHTCAYDAQSRRHAYLHFTSTVNMILQVFSYGSFPNSGDLI